VTTPILRIISSLLAAASFEAAAANPPAPKEKEAKETWWSLKPVVRPALPEGAEKANPIDRFIAA
jgi:hypothetical protein